MEKSFTNITALIVNYNTPDYLERILATFRQYYDIPIWVVDGSDEANFKQIEGFAERYEVKIIHFAFNIHHGPGIAWGFQNIQTDQILLMDSDLIIYHPGFVEDFQNKLRHENYGIGAVWKDDETEKVRYLHPACALINRKIALKYPLPCFYKSPMMAPCRYLQDNHLDLLQDESWVHNDFSGWPHELDPVSDRIIYVQHHWAGTIKRLGTGGV
jgi:glycosyltransferase involved in cell wall biosynthesis